jgi:hypothetical protein
LSVDADNDELRHRFRWLYSWVPRRLIVGQLCAAGIWCSVQVTASESWYYSYKFIMKKCVLLIGEIALVAVWPILLVLVLPEQFVHGLRLHRVA